MGERKLTIQYPMSNIPSSRELNLLIYGYGNPGRQDDGVGIVLVEQLEAWVKAEGIAGIVFDANYQLNAEDALAVAEAAAVIFVDATPRGRAPFTFKRLTPQQVISFSTHAMAPESVLALADELYGARPPAWLMGIRGQEWAPNGPLSAPAQANVAAAGVWLRDWIRSYPPAQGVKIQDGDTKKSEKKQKKVKNS